MNDAEKNKLIKRDMGSVENIVRHAFNQGYNMGYTDGKETIKALEQESCEDTISRQATLEPYKRLKDTDTLCVALIRANIMQQPSINPQKSPQHTKCDQCPYGETKIVNICNYDGDGCGWD